MIKPGDVVELINDTLSGEVKKIKGNRLIIETEDGFLMECGVNEVIPKRVMKFDRRDLEEIRAAKKEKTEKKRSISKKKSSNEPVEVDLHVEELVTDSRNLSNFELLNMQLDKAREFLEYAIRNRIQRLVFIHGVGEGVLRMELETLLRRYEQVEFFDANFQRYGRGATEVYIYQNY